MKNFNDADFSGIEGIKCTVLGLLLFICFYFQSDSSNPSTGQRFCMKWLNVDIYQTNDLYSFRFES